MYVQIFSWAAVVILCLGYWLQVWRIHVHKEVRDLSLTYNILLAIGFLILFVTAIVVRSPVFIVKQIATAIPVCVIVFQIIYHRKDTWHDPTLPHCDRCEETLETHHLFCSHCGKAV